MTMNRWPEPTQEIQDVLDVLENATQVDANEWQARCPVPEHPDTNPSFYLSVGSDQPVTFDCHGGCTYQDIAPVLVGLDIPAAHFGYKGNTLRRVKRRGVKKPELKNAPRSNPVELVPLEDQDKPHEWHAMLMSGKFPKFLEFLTVERGLSIETLERFCIGTDGERITIPVRPSYGPWINVRRYLPHAKGKQEKILNTPGHGRATFYLAELLKENNFPVLVTEGEHDALLANQKSGGAYVAITGTGGAPNAPHDLSPLNGREVFVAYDNDDAGAKGAQKIVDKLNREGAKARVLDIQALGVTGDKEDITDYFMQYNGTADAIAKEMDRLRSGKRLPMESFDATQLAEKVPPMEWMVEGVWPKNSFGVIGAEKKSLKTYNMLALALAVASGTPFLGHFPVPNAMPVLIYLGEGGKEPTMRRLQRITAGIGIDLASLGKTLRMIFQSADMTGDVFLSSLAAETAQLKPGLVIIDPLYAFHPAGVDAQNLYERGAMLAEVQTSIGNDTALIIVDHFRKTGGKDLDLDSIGQSGMGQWADNWFLIKHDSPPRVDVGEFTLMAQFAGRQWGGVQHRINWSLGAFNEKTGDHVGDLSMSVERAEWGAKASGTNYISNITESTIRNLLEQDPLVYTKNQIRDRVKKQAKVGLTTFIAAWDGLTTSGAVVSELAPGAEGKNRPRWRLSEEVRDAVSVSVGGTK